MTAAPVLVIKHGAFGDIVLAMGPITAIRAHHPGQRLIVLTTRPYAGLLGACPLVDEVWTDSKPTWFQPLGWWQLRRKIRRAGFERIYDLQGSGRTNRLFQLLRPHPPLWSGTAAGCALPDRTPDPKSLPPVERHRRQLMQAGLKAFPDPDWSWFGRPVDLSLPATYALIVPGCAAHRPDKRWPAAAYGTLANDLVRQGITPVLLGTKAEADVLSEVAAACPLAINLLERTDLPQIATLARGARFAVGNDTGPMHLIAAVGCRTLTLFSDASNPAVSAPVGPETRWRHAPVLADLPGGLVREALSDWL